MKRILFIITFLVATTNTFADIFDRPAEVNLVVDNANAFTHEQFEALTARLDSLDRASTVQIQIYTTTDLHGYDIVDFAQRLGEGWGVGQAETNNGIVIVYKPKTETENGEVTIQTGYGIEALIPDAVCKRIINNEMIPNFRKDSVYEGINNAVGVCISLVKGEFKAEDYGYSYSYSYDSDDYDDYSGSSYEELTAHDVLGLTIFFVFLIVSVLFSVKYGNKHPSSSTYSSGSYHSSSSHSSRSYGGGHFGGGGARGSW